MAKRKHKIYIRDCISVLELMHKKTLLPREAFELYKQSKTRLKKVPYMTFYPHLFKTEGYQEIAKEVGRKVKAFNQTQTRSNEKKERERERNRNKAISLIDIFIKTHFKGRIVSQEVISAFKLLGREEEVKQYLT